MNPKELVTEAAREAAYKVATVDEMGGAFADEGEFIEAIITAAAPLIAAQALRLLAREVDDDTSRYETYLLLKGCVDEWDGK